MTKTDPMKDAFPAPSYLAGDKGKEIGCLQFEDNAINVLDEESGFSEETANDTFTFEMDLSGDVTIFLFKIAVTGSVSGPINLRIKANDAMTMLNQDFTSPGTIDKAWDVSPNDLLTFYLTSGAHKTRLDLRASALAFLQLHGKPQRYLDLSVDSRSTFGDVRLRLGVLPK